MKLLLQLGMASAALIMMNTEAVNAQIRTIDMETIIDAPAAGSTVTAGKATPFQVSIKNNGPDNLVARDTLFFTFNLPNAPKDVIILPQAINAGQTAVIYQDSITLAINGTTPVTGNFCVHVYDPNSENTDNVILVSYNDPDLTNNSPCSSITVYPAENTSISGIAGHEQPLNLYPNPATSAVTLSFNMKEAAPVTVSVNDIMGKEILQHNYGTIQATGVATVTLNVANLASGIYLVTCHAGAEKFIAKLIKQH